MRKKAIKKARRRIFYAKGINWKLLWREGERDYSYLHRKQFVAKPEATQNSFLNICQERIRLIEIIRISARARSLARSLVHVYARLYKNVDDACYFHCVCALRIEID